jgi:hypothetical protein
MGEYLMPAINFKSQFTDLILSGAKCQTIRRTRKRPIRTGDTLYLYTGLRTKSCYKLKQVICTNVKNILITQADIKYFYCVYVNNNKLDFNEILSLSQADGFDSVTEFLNFFIDQGLPFDGQIIRWEDI